MIKKKKERAEAAEGRLCGCFPFPAILLYKYERQNDGVQHAHPRWMDFEPRLLFLPRAVVFSNYCFLLIGGDQLHIVVQ